jgi:kinesin family protein 5
MELKALLIKAQGANSSHQKYISALEAELEIWRNGGTVPQSEWTSSDKAATAAKKPTPAAASSPTPSTTPSARSGAATPVNPILEGLRGDLESRPQTPTVIGLDKDEREDFLKRENELSDQLAEKETALTSAKKLVEDLREELTFLKEQETSVSDVGVVHLFGRFGADRISGEQIDVESTQRAQAAS